MTIEEVAAELYQEPPDRFTALRETRARALRAGGSAQAAAAVRRLRRPTVSAWAVNALVRRRPDDVDALLDLGQRMRAATAAADPGLRTLGEQRRAAIGELVALARQVAREAGHELPSSAEQEITATLEAATASPEAARAVRSARLVRPIVYAGFGELPLADVVALPDRLPPVPPARVPASAATPPAVPAKPAATRPAATRPAATRPGRERLAEAQRAAREAADAADDAQRGYERRRVEADRTAAALDEAWREVSAVRERLAAAEDRWASARRAASEAERAAQEAQRAARRAHGAADAARERLAALTRTT